MVEDVGHVVAELLRDLLAKDRETIATLLGFSVFCSKALMDNPDLVGNQGESGSVTLSVLGLLNSVVGTATHRLVAVYDGQGQLTKIEYTEWPLIKQQD